MTLWRRPSRAAGGWCSSAARPASARRRSCGRSGSSAAQRPRPLGRLRRAVHAAAARAARRRRRGDRRRARRSWSDGGARPHEVIGRARSASWRADAHSPRARGPALGRRGDARRRCGCSAAGSRAVPALVARDATATTSSTAPTRCGSCSGSSRRRRTALRLRLPPLSRGGGRASWPSRTGSTPADLYAETAGNPFFVTEVLAGGRRGDPGDRARRGARAGGAASAPRARPARGGRRRARRRRSCGCSRRLRRRRVDALDECLASGMLASQGDGVAFRHELARLARSRSRSRPPRGSSSIARALAALERSPAARADLARLAHHAEAAGDAEAVLRFAPAAGDYAQRRSAPSRGGRPVRAGRCGSPTASPPRSRRDLLERRAYECYLTGELDDAIDGAGARARLPPAGSATALRKATRCARFRDCSAIVGRVEEAMRVGSEAVARARAAAPGRELALAYCNLVAPLPAPRGRREETLAWGARALELGGTPRRRPRSLVYALTNIGNGRSVLGPRERDEARAEPRARAATPGSRSTPAAPSSTSVWWSPRGRSYDVADRYLDAGARVLHRARARPLAPLPPRGRGRGRSSTAGAGTRRSTRAAAVVRDRRTSPVPRVVRALRARPRARAARRPDVWPALDEAWALAAPTGELQRIEPRGGRAGRGAWLAGRAASEVAGATERALEPGARAGGVVDRRRARRAGGGGPAWPRRSPGEVPRAVRAPSSRATGAARPSCWDGLGCSLRGGARAGRRRTTRKRCDERPRASSGSSAPSRRRRSSRAACAKRGVRGLPRGPRPRRGQTRPG